MVWEAAKALTAKTEKAMLRRIWRFMRVCSGVFIGWYGADVTPGIFYENFIDVMVNIDSNDGW
jgi:hypothetical protein